MPRVAKQYRLETETVAEIDLYSRLQRLEYTTFVEQAVMERIRQAKLQHPNVDSHYISKWAANGGQVALRLFRLAEKQISMAWQPSEEPLRRFVAVHSAFFYDGDEPLDFAVTYIWPLVDQLAANWPGADYWQPGMAMQKIYLANGIEPPQWPPKDEATREADSKRARKKQ